MIVSDHFHRRGQAQGREGGSAMVARTSVPDPAAATLLPFVGPLAHAFERHTGAAPETLAKALPALLREPATSLPVPPASDRGVWGEGGSADAPTIAEIVDRAEADLALPWPQPRA